MSTEAEQTKEVMQLPDGLYIGLPEEIYHAQKRMSGSKVKDIDVSAPTFWANSWMNPDKEEKDADHFALGKAYHCARLEPTEFHQRFIRKISKDDYEDTPSSGTTLGEALNKLGEAKKKSGETVLSQAIRLKDAGYPGKLYHLDLRDWEATQGDRIAINPADWDDMIKSMKAIENCPEVNQHLRGGIAEVSFLWTVYDEAGNAIGMQCRFDYLKPNSYSDFKTYANSMSKHVKRCIMDAYRFNRYYISAYLYWEATEIIRTTDIDIYQFETEGDGFDIPEKLESHPLVDAIKMQKVPLETIYIFQEKKGVPNLFAYKIDIFRPESDAANNHQGAGAGEEQIRKVGDMTRYMSLLSIKARMDISHALMLFQQYSEVYGIDGKPWQNLDQTGTIGDLDFPSYFFE